MAWVIMGSSSKEGLSKKHAKWLHSGPSRRTAPRFASAPPPPTHSHTHTQPKNKEQPNKSNKTQRFARGFRLLTLPSGRSERFLYALASDASCVKRDGEEEAVWTACRPVVRWFDICRDRKLALRPWLKARIEVFHGLVEESTFAVSFLFGPQSSLETLPMGLTQAGKAFILQCIYVHWPTPSHHNAVSPTPTLHSMQQGNVPLRKPGKDRWFLQGRQQPSTACQVAEARRQGVYCLL